MPKRPVGLEAARFGSGAAAHCESKRDSCDFHLRLRRMGYSQTAGKKLNIVPLNFKPDRKQLSCNESGMDTNGRDKKFNARL
jgi:hypothetical protein